MEPKQSYKENNYPYYHQVIGNDISNTWHDAAQKELGGDWRMPTKEEWHELLFPPSMNGYLYMTVKGICLQQKTVLAFSFQQTVMHTTKMLAHLTRDIIGHQHFPI